MPKTSLTAMNDVSGSGLMGAMLLKQIFPDEHVTALDERSWYTESNTHGIWWDRFLRPGKK